MSSDQEDAVARRLEIGLKDRWYAACPASFVTQRVFPVVLSSAQTRPSQSPAYSTPPTTTGDDSDGPIVFFQRTLPLPTASATISPVSRESGVRLHGGRFMNAW